MKIAFTHNLKTHDGDEQAEFDTPETVAAIRGALTRLGHDVHLVEVSGPASRLVARLESLQPDLVFNTAEGSHGRYREAFYPSLFEQLGLAYTGSDAWTCAMTLDKHGTKLLLAERGVPTPRWAFVERVSGLEGLELRFPVIAKPNFEGSSKGVSVDSVARDLPHLRSVVEGLLSRYPEGLLLEEFIVGRDLTVPFLEGIDNGYEGVLAPAAYHFDEAVTGDRPFQIYDYTLKNELSDAVEVEVPAKVSAETEAALRRYTAVAMRALRIRDMGRADFRVTPEGDLYFIEVNALPSLEPGASFYLSSALEGLETAEQVLGQIIAHACQRQGRQEVSASARPRVGLTYNLKRIDPKKGDDAEAEYDAPDTIKALREAIESLGCEVMELEASPELMSLLPGAALDIVFNIAEGIGGRSREAQVPAMLDLLGLEYTGSDATTMCITLDKGLAKRVVAQSGVPTAAFCVMRSASDELPPQMKFPLVVKPLAEGSSKGIEGTSVVHDEVQLRKLVDQMQARYKQAVLVENFLSGREFTVAVLGEGAPRVLPAMEVVFGKSAGQFPVYSFAHKLSVGEEVTYQVPAAVDPALARELEQVALRSFEALGCRDVARIDIRLDGEGRACFIECNPLPGLTPGWSDLCLIAEGAGMDYRSLIGELMAPAWKRWRAAKEGGR